MGFVLVPLAVEPRARLRGWSGLFVSPVAVDAVLCGERAAAAAADDDVRRWLDAGRCAWKRPAQ